MLSLKMRQEIDEDLDYMLVLNKMKEVIWVNEKANRFLESNLNIEQHVDSTGLADWYGYLDKLKQSTIKKSYISLLNKNKKLNHFITYGLFNHWNETYVINFRPVTDQLSLFEIYDKTFKMLDEIHIGAYVSRINGFIFSANETAKYIVPNACQMSVVKLFKRFFDNEQFGQYIKLLNRKESFSVDVTCQNTNKNYHLMYKFDHDVELHVIMIQQLQLKDIAVKRLQPYDYLDKQTAASIVHEIRNPISALQGFVDLMKEDKIPNIQYLQMLDYELRRMDHLLNGMLQYLKPKAECVPIECSSFLQKILLLLETDVKSKNICLIYSQSSEPCYILANEYSLTQVFINIIKNSIQAVDTNGSITIVLNKLQNNKLEVCIKDSGCGINEEQLVHLFTPYYTTKEGGTGLGLSIVKKLLEEMEGRIEVKSIIGQGTEVYMYLPLAAECNCLFEDCAD